MTTQQVSPAHFGPAIFEPLADVLLAQVAPRPGDRVLDVACGTGIVVPMHAHIATAHVPA